MRRIRTTPYREAIARMLNELQRGQTYRSRTSTGRTVAGEYLGTEVIHGDRAILLRHDGGTTSIPTRLLVSIIKVDGPKTGAIIGQGTRR